MIDFRDLLNRGFRSVTDRILSSGDRPDRRSGAGSEIGHDAVTSMLAELSRSMRGFSNFRAPVDQLQVSQPPDFNTDPDAEPATTPGRSQESEIVDTLQRSLADFVGTTVRMIDGVDRVGAIVGQMGQGASDLASSVDQVGEDAESDTQNPQSWASFLRKWGESSPERSRRSEWSEDWERVRGADRSHPNFGSFLQATVGNLQPAAPATSPDVSRQQSTSGIDGDRIVENLGESISASLRDGRADWAEVIFAPMARFYDRLIAAASSVFGRMRAQPADDREDQHSENRGPTLGERARNAIGRNGQRIVHHYLDRGASRGGGSRTFFHGATGGAGRGGSGRVLGGLARMFGGGGGGGGGGAAAGGATGGGGGAAAGGAAAGGAGGALAAGGLLLAFVALAAVVAMAAKAIKDLGMQGFHTAMRISQFNGELMVAKTQLEVGRLLRDIQSAQTMASSGSKMAGAIDRLEESLRPLTDGVLVIAMEFLAASINALTGMIEMAQHGPTGKGWLDFMFPGFGFGEMGGKQPEEKKHEPAQLGLQDFFMREMGAPPQRGPRNPIQPLGANNKAAP